MWIALTFLFIAASRLSIISASKLSPVQQKRIQTITKKVEDASVSFYFKNCDRTIWVISAFLANYQIAAKAIQSFHV